MVLGVSVKKILLSYGITVITLDFDSSNRGSIPRGTTKNGDMAERLRRRSAKSITWVRILLSPQQTGIRGARSPRLPWT